MKHLPLYLAMLLGALCPLQADEAGDLEKKVEQIDEQSKEMEVSDEVLEEIEKETKVPVEELKKQQAKSKLSTGSLFMANVIAGETGKSFDEITAEHKAGKGWGRIARDHNVKLGPLVSQARKLEKQQKQIAAKNKGKKKAATPGKPEKENKGKGGEKGGGKGKK